MDVSFQSNLNSKASHTKILAIEKGNLHSGIYILVLEYEGKLYSFKVIQA